MSIRMRMLFVFQYLSFKNNKSNRFRIRWHDRWPCYSDATPFTGFDKHYVYHTAWACRILSELSPEKHVDISSSLYFCASASAFVPIEFYDYRPADLRLGGLTCKQGDILKLPFEDNQVESLSCMHVIEHIGLGRYGDPLDYDGDLKAAQELSRVVALGGYLMVVVPVGGVSKIQFNAHRIYKHIDLVRMFPGLTLIEFSLIPDDSSTEGLIRHADEELVERQVYGCGCFLFRKPGNE
ncbi:MAG: DUF268 domain-containing protein [Geobacteraceae bacterium]|nr:DUF268 domain-containing protein [Geobacteraceae bacterium]